MYCNSCMTQIPKDQVTYCEQCQVPLHIKCANHCTVCGKTLCDTCYAENNFKCEECGTPEEDISVIRRSFLEQYAGCPYSLKLQLLEGIEPPMGGAAQLGVIVHELIDKISHDKSLELEAIKGELEDKVMDWNTNTDEEYSIITDELLNNGFECLDSFWMIKDSFNSEFVSEHKIKFSIDDDLPMVSCTLDRINFVGDDIIICDWKTGKPMSGQKLITDLQPALYIYAVLSEYGRLPKSFNLFYLKHEKVITYTLTGDMEYTVKTSRSEYKLDVNDALKRTKKILKGIKEGRFNKTGDTWRCNKLCWFGLSGKCSYGLQEQWKDISDGYDMAC